MQNIESSTDTTPSTLRAVDFKMTALDLNPDLAVPVRRSTPLATPVAVEQPPAPHWISLNPVYQGAIGDLLGAVRVTHRLANIDDARTDPEFSSDLIKTMGLWNQPQPVGWTATARFMLMFLIAFSRLYWHVKAQEGALNRRPRPVA